MCDLLTGTSAASGHRAFRIGSAIAPQCGSLSLASASRPTFPTARGLRFSSVWQHEELPCGVFPALRRAPFRGQDPLRTVGRPRRAKQKSGSRRGVRSRFYRRPHALQKFEASRARSGLREGVEQAVAVERESVRDHPAFQRAVAVERHRAVRRRDGTVPLLRLGIQGRCDL